MTRFKPSYLLVPMALAAATAGQAAPPAPPQVERVAPDRLVVSWPNDGAADVFVSSQPDATSASARLVSDDDGDGRHELAATPGERIYVLVRAEGDGTVHRAAERLIPLAQGSNFRDIGGYPGADGKQVRWGMIYRSGATPLLTAEDVAQVRALGIANLVDLRSSEERALAPTRLDGIAYSAVGYAMADLMAGSGKVTELRNGGTIYRGFPALLAPQLRIIFDKLLEDEGALAFNCSAGQDRTGFATAMILTALGVPRDVIIADYHLSTAYRQPEFEMPVIDPAAHPGNTAAQLFAGYQRSVAGRRPQPLMSEDGKAYLLSAFEEVEARWGSVDAYLEQEVGIDAAEIAALQASYLE